MRAGTAVARRVAHPPRDPRSAISPARPSAMATYCSAMPSSRRPSSGASRGGAERLAIDGREVAVSNPGKVLFPEAGHTKLDLVRYYLAVADGALRGAGGRPNVLVRYPNGLGDEHFFQKRAPKSRPAWVEVVALKFPSGRSAEEAVSYTHLRAHET